jgi:hypothetical protein
LIKKIKDNATTLLGPKTSTAPPNIRLSAPFVKKIRKEEKKEEGKTKKKGENVWI